jgi:prevent-host-death family protein
MIRLPASEAREKFSEVLSEVSYGGQRMVLQRHGKDLVAMIPVEDLALLEELEDRADLVDVKAAMAAKAPRIPWGKVKAKHGLK